MEDRDGSNAFTVITARDIALRIRKLRKARGWTLQDIQSRSGGEIKSVVMGSYERNSRTISLPRAIAIAALFEIPLQDLLGEGAGISTMALEKCTFDQRRIANTQLQDLEDKRLELDRYLKAIALRRRDWNGEVLTLRGSDLDILTLMLNMDLDQMTSWLQDNAFILQS